MPSSTHSRCKITLLSAIRTDRHPFGKPCEPPLFVVLATLPEGAVVAWCGVAPTNAYPLVDQRVFTAILLRETRIVTVVLRCSNGRRVTASYPLAERIIGMFVDITMKRISRMSDLIVVQTRVGNEALQAGSPSAVRGVVVSTALCVVVVPSISSSRQNLVIWIEDEDEIRSILGRA